MAKTKKQVISGYHRPVCPKCNRELHPEKNGVGVLDLNAKGKPYKIYDADLWKCPGCGIEVVGGFGIGPISAHHEDSFQKVLDGYGVVITNTG